MKTRQDRCDCGTGPPLCQCPDQFAQDFCWTRSQHTLEALGKKIFLFWRPLLFQLCAKAPWIVCIMLLYAFVQVLGHGVLRPGPLDRVESTVPLGTVRHRFHWSRTGSYRCIPKVGEDESSVRGPASPSDDATCLTTSAVSGDSVGAGALSSSSEPISSLRPLPLLLCCRLSR